MYKEYLEQLIRMLYKVEYYAHGDRMKDAEAAFGEICEIFRLHRDRHSHVFFIGNGGSAGIAQHMTADFLKNAGLKTISLYNQANLTCLGNDIGYGAIFASQIEW